MFSWLVYVYMGVWKSRIITLLWYSEILWLCFFYQIGYTSLICVNNFNYKKLLISSNSNYEIISLSLLTRFILKSNLSDIWLHKPVSFLISFVWHIFLFFLKNGFFSHTIHSHHSVPSLPSSQLLFPSPSSSAHLPSPSDPPTLHFLLGKQQASRRWQ